MIRKSRFTAMLLFTACLLLFDWPLISIPDESAGLSTLLYLFFCWAAVIAGLRTFCRNEMKLCGENEEGEKNV